MKARSRFAGMFYPEAPDLLRQAVAQFLVGEPEPRTVLGLLVPHAGYVYSGETAGAAFARARRAELDAVVLIGPSHRVDVGEGRVLEVDHYETPLGDVATDPRLASALATGAHLDLGPPIEEHSLEVQLPFLVDVAPGVPVVEIALGWPDPDVARSLAEALIATKRERSLLVVASSDLSHYHDQARARELDDRFTTLLESGDPRTLFAAWRGKQIEACGLGAVLTLMELASRRSAHFEVVSRSDSSEAFGDRDRVVGYLSGLWVGEDAA